MSKAITMWSKVLMVSSVCSLIISWTSGASAAAESAEVAVGNLLGAPMASDSLASTMSKMNADLKIISAQVSDATKNESSIKLAEDFTAAVLHAETFVPDSVSSLPSDQQGPRLILFKKMLDSVAASGEQLALAFRKSQNSQAAAILKSLAQMKADGHAEFMR